MCGSASILLWKHGAGEAAAKRSQGSHIAFGKTVKRSINHFSQTLAKMAPQAIICNLYLWQGGAGFSVKRVYALLMLKKMKALGHFM